MNIKLYLILYMYLEPFNFIISNRMTRNLTKWLKCYAIISFLYKFLYLFHSLY